MKIYDCFTFYNELDILELRLSEHYDHVDHFVIAEASKTHQGRDKPYFLQENWDRFKNFHDKIIHIKVDDMPTHPNAWVPENFQREALSRGLTGTEANDIVIISDADEIMRANAFNIIRNSEFKLYTCRCPIFYFKLNYMMIHPNAFWINHVAVRAGLGYSPQTLRNMTHQFSSMPYDYVNNDICTIPHGGWHFTYFGNSEHAANKLRNFAHQESIHLADKVSTDDFIKHKRGLDSNCDERFEYIVIDEYFPETILKNKERWKDYIIPNATAQIKDYLPGLK